MKYYLIIFLIALFAAGCNTSPLQDHLDEADRLTIKFNDQNNQDSVIKIVKTSDEKAIDKLINFIDGDSEENIKCGYAGTLIFMQGEKELQKVNFSMQSNCSYFFYSLNNKTNVIEMGNEAADFLNALYLGRNFY